MRPKSIEWPNKAKIAVSFFVGLESFVKYSQYRGSGDRVDYASVAFGEYGGKVGIWRILDVFTKHQVKGTIDTNGLAAERYPDAVKELHSLGHEIVGHGWSNDVPPGAGRSRGTPGNQADSGRDLVSDRQASGWLG